MGADASLSPELIEAKGFTTSFRGFDPAEVHAFLGRVAADIRAMRERADRLESAWHSAEERAARPPVLDEDTLMAAVGEETATILRAARSAATELRARAAQDAERIVAEADERGAQIRAEAEGVLAREVKAAEEAAARLVDSARTEAAEALDKARTEADAIRAAAQHDKALTIDGAISTRERILEDLSRRRRVASVQIEQLRAGRERLLQSYGVVRRTLEEVNDELNRADAEARAAADEAGRRMQRDHPVEPTEPVEPIDAVAVIEDAAPPVAEEPAAAETANGTSHPEPTAEDPAPQPEPTQAEPVKAEPVKAGPVKAGPVKAGTGGLRGGGKRRGRGGSHALAAAEEVPQASAAPAPAEAPVPHLRVVPDPHQPEVGTLLAEPPAPASAAPGIPAPGSPAPGSKVDVLFARIRAGRVDKGAEVVVEQPADPSPAEAATGDDMEPVRSDADETLLQRREAAVVDLEVALTRKLKRTLQDEQNDLLDRLRGLRGEPTTARLLPDVADQVARYASAAQPHVDAAASAGVSFAVELLHRKGRAHASAPSVADLARESATTIVESLRRRLEHAISASAGDEQPVLVEALGGAYREWKSERIERVAGDVLAAAFSRGTWHEAPDATPLRWIVEDTDGPCPDCDDDALAGTLPKGEPFPTGQLYPPAHAGCRCLLVPVEE